ncbi:hypothetical protein SNEBB_005804 [Seison nebaliae]|nr:hypothetical protein SNEBB_005804 [Seison nebaliae]
MPHQYFKVVGGTKAQEEQKKLQYKNDRKDRELTVTSIHTYFSEIMGITIKNTTQALTGLDAGPLQNRIIEMMLDNTTEWPAIQEFEDGDLNALIFAYQNGIIPESAGRGAQLTMPRLYILSKEFLKNADKNKISLNGYLFIFLKRDGVKKEGLNTANYSNNIFYHTINLKESDICQEFSFLISNVFGRFLTVNKEWWTSLDETLSEATLKKEKFVDQINFFSTFLKHCSAINKSIIKFDEPLPQEIKDIKSPGDCLKLLKKPELVNNLEDTVEHWIVKINQLLIDSDQIRQERSDTGPIVELEHWQTMSAKFNFMLDQLNTPTYNYVIYLLNGAQSKKIPQWKRLMNRIIDYANETKDNLRYLDVLMEHCHSLYTTDIQAMINSIPKIMNTVRLINSCSEYYNTPEKISSLLVKITTQMVTSCYKYLTEDGTKDIRKIPSAVLRLRICQCLELFDAYKKAYNGATDEIAKNTDEKPLECSQVYIFIKFQKFAERLKKINTIVDWIEQFSSLASSSMDNMVRIAKNFKQTSDAFYEGDFDVLHIEKTDFQFERFNDNLLMEIENLKVDLYALMKRTICPMHSSNESIRYLNKFKELNIPFFNYEEELLMIMVTKYNDELENIKEIYNAKHNHANHVLERNMPLHSGMVNWARLLFKRLEQPMGIFRKYPNVMSAATALPVINRYNKACSYLIQFENAYVKLWKQNLNRLLDALVLPIFQYANNQFSVNFSPNVDESLREIRIMKRLNIEMPPFCYKLHTDSLTLKTRKSCAYELVRRMKSLKSSIPSHLKLITGQYVTKAESTFREGLANITWISYNADSYLKECSDVLDRIEQDVTKARYLLDVRVYNLLIDLENVKIVELPEHAVTFNEFTNIIKQNVSTARRRMNNISEQICDNIQSLVKSFLWSDKYDISLLTGKTRNEMTKEEFYKLPMNMHSAMEKFRDPALGKEKKIDDMMKFISSYERRTIDAMIKAIKNSLDAVKRRVITTLFYRSAAASKRLFRTDNSAQKERIEPLLICDIVLDDEDIVLEPNIDRMQLNLIKVVHQIVGVGKYLVKWGDDENFATYSHMSPDASSFTPKRSNFQSVSEPQKSEYNMVNRGYFKVISDNKDIAFIMTSLSAAIKDQKMKFHQTLTTFEEFNHLFLTSHTERVEEFMGKNPNISDVMAELQETETTDERLSKVAAKIVVEPLEMHTEKLIQKLKSLSKNLTNILGQALREKYRYQMDSILMFIDEMNPKLEKKLVDLDDARFMIDALNEFRSKFMDIDLQIGPIEDIYAILTKFDIYVSADELNQIDALRYHFNQLSAKANVVTDRLLEIQPPLFEKFTNSIEDFKNDVKVFLEEYETAGPNEAGIEPSIASDRLAIFRGKFDHLWRKYETFTAGNRIFGVPKVEYPVLDATKQELDFLNRLYSLYRVVNTAIDSFYDMTWSDVDIELVGEKIHEFQVLCNRLPTELKTWAAYVDLKKRIDDFKECVPLLEMMTNKSMQLRHWVRIEQVTGHTFAVESPTFLLKNVMEAPLLKNKDDITEICLTAMKEKDIEYKLKQIKHEWDEREFSFSTFKNRGELLLEGAEVTEAITILEESLMNLSSLLSNRYNTFFRQPIQQFINKLTMTNDILENWVQVQNLWIYLEAVFASGDIAKQLPKEAKRFSNIDKSWLKIMMKAHETRNILTCCTTDDTLSQILPHLLEQLEFCRKSLSGYLESKRQIFPRFYFVSDPVLLKILGQASDSHTIQPHLLSVFENVDDINWSKTDYDTIEFLYSKEREIVRLYQHVSATGNVETWLNTLLKIQRGSLHMIIRSAYNQITDDPDYTLMGFLRGALAQIGILVLQFIWTSSSEKALLTARQNRLLMTQTNKYWEQILSDLVNEVAKELSKFDRVKFQTFVIIHIHQRDIFDELCRHNVRSVGDFEWIKQSRFYFDVDEDVLNVHITDVIFRYQNEFLGCTERLVITPLTDRCYISLAQAIGMNYGGAPAGPAGTGKTETTKDMGKALGKYVVVFNMSDQMDFRGLGRIYKGLGMSGTWGCFDEFNRINLPVLSVAAQQISVLLIARKTHAESFVFTDGDTCSMNEEFGLFITMNPGYAGRQELPENLKIQFRTVAMMVPDRQIIIRVKLASIGFQTSVPLSKKFFTLYKLCDEQLSKQVHYDFGLRNILSVLRASGGERRSKKNDSEEDIILRVLRDMNISKLVDNDEILFLSLLKDLFPDKVLKEADYSTMQRIITDVVQELNLVNEPLWNLKIRQLFETQLTRHGLMMLGPSGTGKTTCINTMMKTLTLLNEPHKEMRMNPKAITAGEMFGTLDVATNDWTDGIFSTLWRRTLKVKKNDHVWLVLDGPVDAIWIENLNSVLDDNKTLTLANGDRIPMANNCKIVFEVHNIDNASPATVSRNGMVYMGLNVLPWEAFLKSWLVHRSPNTHQIMLSTFKKLFEPLFLHLTHNLVLKMSVFHSNFIIQACNLLGGLLENESTIEKAHLEKLIIFSLMWSMGALLELPDRYRFEEFIFDKFSDMPLPTIESGSLFDFYVKPNGEWDHWSNKVEKYDYPKHSIPDYLSILVPNIDNVRSMFLLKTITKQGKCVLFIGEQGTAKTAMINTYLKQLNPETDTSKTLNFSSTTTPGILQSIVESFVDKRAGNTYGPSGGRRMTIFIDDISMPQINEWGDQVTNEILRQLVEFSGFYSLTKPGEFLVIDDIQFVAAMIHGGGGRNDIPQRLKRHFSIFNCTLPSNHSVDKIFGIIGQGYFCKERGFSPVVIEEVENLVPLTRLVWQMVKVRMLPTPAKFHYVFNLRDLSRIWQGMLRIRSKECSDKATFRLLWRHEMTRVIADRFISEDDQKAFQNLFMRLTAEYMEEEAGETFANDAYFVNFMKTDLDFIGDEEESPTYYELVPGFDELKAKLLTFMHRMNADVRGCNMDLVFFQNAMIHLVRISRVLTMPRGNLLLLGIGGSGKQSLTKLASFISGYKVFQIALTRTYNISNFLDHLKVLYRLAVTSVGVTFIFTDNDVKHEGFLEYLNNVISSGEVSNLFPKDELEEITQALIPMMKKQYPKVNRTNEALYDFFIEKAKANIHVALCFSPVGDKFRNRSLKFPALTSGCTIDFFEKWPLDALIAVASHHIGRFPMECSNENRKSVIETMSRFHDTISTSCELYFNKYRRRAFVTPKSFLSYLDVYKKVYTDQLVMYQKLKEKMQSGLSKLLEAKENVLMLSEELVVKEKELEVLNAAAQKVLEQVQVQTEEAEIIKNQVSQVKKKAEDLVEQINAEKEIASEKLAAAKPALDAAEAALKTIQPSDIQTVRKLGKPPHLIQRIMDCVLIYMRRRLDPVIIDAEKPEFIKPSWSESLRVLSDVGFLKKLQEYPKDNIDGEQVELLEPYFLAEDYKMEVAKKVCGNVAGLAQWTLSLSKYYDVNRYVMPLKDNLAAQEHRFQLASNELEAAEAQLREKEMELQALTDRYNDARRKKEALEEEANILKQKMMAASNLVEGLGDERVRWTENVHEFQERIEKLVGDVLFSVTFLSYGGTFNQFFRLKLVQRWRKEIGEFEIPNSGIFNFIEMFTDDHTIIEWNLQGLPNDKLSIENGVIIHGATRYPLIIDPQIQAKTWIKNREKNNSLVVSHLNSRWFRNHLEDCVSLGRPLLVEDVGEELDPVLDNVADRNYIKLGKTLNVKVGDKEIAIADGFRLYITTKLSNPIYTPEVYAQYSVIDFTVTVKGLEEQLLGRVITNEKAELETERIDLLNNVTDDKRKLKELEDNLLYKLSSVQGSLLDDPSLLEVLNTTKSTSNEVREKLKIAAITEKKINLAREEYRPIATRGSILYFLLVEMTVVNNMYQTSLQQFLKKFDESMHTAQPSPIPARRIENVVNRLTHIIFYYASRGIYEEDRYTFVLLMTIKIDMEKGRIHVSEMNVLVKGGASLDLNNVTPKPCKWINDATWLNLVELSHLNTFSDILERIPKLEKAWRHWYDSEAPEKSEIPDGYSASLDSFGKLLLIRCWCPDRILMQAREYIAESLSQMYAEPVMLDMQQAYDESNGRTPIIFLLSMGSDPTDMILAFAKKHSVECRSISMGQGQEVHARRLVKSGLTNGGWILFQNCHLGLDYMDELLDVLTTTENIHEDFRLWITTAPMPNFPINLLQIGIRLTNEPPQGLRAGLRRTYQNISLDLLNYTNAPQWKPLLYAVSYLHSVVQERRKYGPLGWNIPYEFNASDFQATIQYVQRYLDNMEIGSRISWSAVRYMISEIQYGGRVTDDFDKKLLKTFAKVWFNDEMFKEEFRFVKSKFTSMYYIPTVRTITEYLDYIDTLPRIDPPQAYGLHYNADITYLSKTAQNMFDTIMATQPKESTGEGEETRESVVYRMCGDMVGKLPPDYVPHEVLDRVKLYGINQPMCIFLRQEVDRMNKVIVQVRRDLIDLRLAVDGTIILNENLRECLDNIYDAKVPAGWTKLSWSSTTIGFWFTELLDRNTQYHHWLFEVRPNLFWLGGFFNPQGFLTAMKQEVTRQNDGWTLDSVVMNNQVTKSQKEDIKTAPLVGVYIYGLFLEGAGWDRRRSVLVESQPKVSFSQLPVVHVFAERTAEPAREIYYNCPIYKKAQRTDLQFVTVINLTCLDRPDHTKDFWTMRGVALLCDIK